MTSWPPLDTHAHIAATIAPTELLALRAVIFAASRSLDESRAGLDRQHTDLLTVWGAGVHPGVKAALDGYDPAEFAALADRTAYVGEIGLDGRVPSRLGQQREVLRSILTCLQQRPRLTSIHSSGATEQVLEELERTPTVGVILHWWLGDRVATRRALELGAHFSFNSSSIRKSDSVDLIPLERILLETDHPDGNRGTQPRRPGNISGVERALAELHRITPTEMRQRTWGNLAHMVDTTETAELLPSRVAAIVSATP